MDYNISDLDDHGILKPGFFLLCVVVALSRQVLYGPLALLAKRKGRGGGANMDISWLNIGSYWEFVACLPALFVLLLLFKRRADAATWVKKSWGHGRSILLVGASLQIATMLIVTSRGAFEVGIPTLVLLVLHVYLLVYLVRAQRVKDVFSMFPQK